MKTEWSRIFSRCIGGALYGILFILIIGGCEYILPNKPPYVEKTSPADDAAFNIGSVIPFKVNAYDVDGSIDSVVFTAPGSAVFIDTEAPYEFNWNTAGMSEGAFQVEISAIDNDDEPYIIKVAVRLVGSTQARAGDDATVSTSSTTYVLQAEAATSGTGTWSIVAGAGGQISDLNDPNATLTGVPCQAYILRWTVVNVVSQSSDDVLIRFMHLPSTAFAGADQIVGQGITTVTLGASIPSEGTGMWKIETGGEGVFSDMAQPASEFTGQACTNYRLVWSVSTACAVSSDTVDIRFEQFTVEAAAGPDQFYLDGRTETTLSGNSLVVGTGTWTIVAGSAGEFSDSNLPHASFSGQICQTYILRWTVSTACGSSSDDVVITFDHIPTDALAGPDIRLTGTSRSVNLAGNVPEEGSGEWAIVSGSGGVIDSPGEARSLFTGEPCETYILRWTISTQCDASSDQMTIVIIDLPSEANAGPDQKLVDGSTVTELNANLPLNGTGLWSITDGGTGSFSDPEDPHATFSGDLCSSYTLRWTISTACESSSDEMTVVFNEINTQADAGPDQSLTNGTISTRMHANSPGQAMSGTWTVVNGSGGSFTDENDPETVFSGQLGQVYKLKWSLNSLCAENSDVVLIAFLNSQVLYDARDGQAYFTIGLGNQEWMASNLNYATTEGSYAFGNTASNATTYGRLYTWSAASGACPSGWHLPSDGEWRQLEKVLGMDESTTLLEWYRGVDEGGMLKEAGLARWQNPNTGATNISAFKALPGGYRTPSGTFGGLTSHAGFWTTTVNDDNKAMYRALHKDKAQIGRDWSETGYGFSVRCVKN